MGKRLRVRKMRSSARGCLELGVCFSTRIRTLEYNRNFQYPSPSGTEGCCLESEWPVGCMEPSWGSLLNCSLQSVKAHLLGMFGSLLFISFFSRRGI